MSSPTPHSVARPHLAAVQGDRAPDTPAPSREFTGKRAATRNRLMDACANLIVMRGFDGVSMTSIAEEAGITRQTVYRYFSNSQEVVQATLNRSGSELLEGQILVFGGVGDPRELLLEAVTGALRRIRQDALLRVTWASKDYPQAMLRSVFDPAFAARGVEGLSPIAGQLGWDTRDTHEAYEIIARTVMSFLVMPPALSLSEDDLKDGLRRRLLPALGV